MEINKVALVGFGAIGCIYAKGLINGCNDFTVVAGGARGQRIKTTGVKVNGTLVLPKVVSPKNDDWKADLIIFTVKNYQLAEAIEDVRNMVTDDTILLPLLNGVTAVDELKGAYPNNNVLYGIALGIDAVRTDDGITNSSDGVIQFGNAKNVPVASDVSAVKEVFDKSGIESEICEDMLRTMWRKWMINVSTNQLSAIIGCGYGGFLNVPQINEAMHQVMLEVIALAQKKGINITKEDAYAYDELLPAFNPEGKTSMAQDVEAKRKTEVDYFSGVAIRYGKELGVETPWNNMMNLIIKGIEAGY
ncbi:MAG: ketopantoate reductase family protein [Anaerotignaceae bacterium]